MNYTWNIRHWVRMVLAFTQRKPKRTGVLVAVVANIKQATGSADTLYKQFLDFMQYCRLRTRYNCQTASLQALLNKIFDPSLNRIYLVTTSDLISTNYGQIAEDAQSLPVIYGKKNGEAITTIYGYKLADYANAFDGYVYVPAELAPREAEIKKWIDLNVFLARTYKINYF